MIRINLYKIIFLVCYWVLAAIFFVFFEGTLINYHSLSTNIFGLPYSLTRSLVISVVITIIGGAAIGTFEVLYFSKLLRKQPLGITLIKKTSFYLLNIFVFTSIAVIISASIGLGNPLFDNKVIALYLNHLKSQGLVLIMVYWSIAVMTGLFLLQINDKLGQGVLVNYLLGKYHKPKEEVRIFMFLDLKSSTSYAEEYGHKKYSHLIQDCFYDLADVVINRKASVYQYVGDEVVLTWKPDIGIKDNNCLSTYFDFARVIKDKSEYYKTNYDVVPQFKAGLHYGEAVITELGGAKKEIAYHGDTVNTTSRIQEACNGFNKCLLISANLLGLLQDEKLDEKYSIESAGIVKLKGKKHVIGLFSVEEHNGAMVSA